MKLTELLQGIAVLECTAAPDTEIASVCYDSRKAGAGALFVAIVGYATDGHAYIGMAKEKGAAAVLCERKPCENVPYILVKNSRRALALLGANFFRHPAREMCMIGVTGTNGKTTSTYLLKQILERCCGAKVGLIGTNQNMIGEKVIPTERTTPESFELHRLFREMADAGCSHVVMEVSSHALYEDRVYGIDYALSLFTNLTQDHLDFHSTMENYCDAKALLYRQSKIGVVNADDAWAERLLKDSTSHNVFYGVHSAADYTASDISLASDHVAYTVHHGGESHAAYAALPGEFNVYNSLGVLAAACEVSGITLSDAVAALKTAAGAKGRVEVIPTPGKDYTILIDYAHTPDALENVLRTAKGFSKGRVVAVFGCGGDRDKLKRPIMGRIAAANADFVIVTSDNPRTEVPCEIIKDILAGMEDCPVPYAVVENRVEAVHYAMDHAEANDVIVLCGKGHETYQEIDHVKHHLDEREVVAAHLR